MENDLYTVSQLAKISGITPRTIRYYDKIDLLKPTLINENGYRNYDIKQLDRLQQILYFKQFGFELTKVKEMIEKPKNNIIDSLENQQLILENEIKQKQHLLNNLEKTISYYKGEIKMTNKEKFAALKNNLIMQNEEKFGKEAKENYGEKEYEQGLVKFKSLTEKQYQTSQKLEKEMIENLAKINENNLSINSNLAKVVFEQHQTWLKIFYDKYNSNYHLVMANLYEHDARFAEYYNSRGKADVTATLIKIIRNYA